MKRAVVLVLAALAVMTAPAHAAVYVGPGGGLGETEVGDQLLLAFYLQWDETDTFTGISVEAFETTGMEILGTEVPPQGGPGTIWVGVRLVGEPRTDAYTRLRVSGIFNGEPVTVESARHKITVREGAAGAFHVNGDVPEEMTVRAGDRLTYSVLVNSDSGTPIELTGLVPPTPVGTTLVSLTDPVPSVLEPGATAAVHKVVQVNEGLRDLTPIDITVANPIYAMSTVGLAPRPPASFRAGSHRALVHAANVRLVGHRLIDLNGGELQYGDPVISVATIRNDGHAPATSAHLALALDGFTPTAWPSVDGGPCLLVGSHPCTYAGDSFAVRYGDIAPGQTVTLRHDGFVEAETGAVSQAFHSRFLGDETGKSPLNDVISRELAVAADERPALDGSPPVADGSPPVSAEPPAGPAAAAQRRVPGLTELAALPARRSCRRGLRLQLAQPDAAPVLFAIVRFAGKRLVRDAGPSYGRPFLLRDLPAKGFSLQLTLLLSDGTLVRGGRRYAPCRARRK